METYKIGYLVNLHDSNDTWRKIEIVRMASVLIPTLEALIAMMLTGDVIIEYIVCNEYNVYSITQSLSLSINIRPHSYLRGADCYDADWVM